MILEQIDKAIKDIQDGEPFGNMKTIELLKAAKEEIENPEWIIELDEKKQRFEAAKAAMQGYCASPNFHDISPKLKATMSITDADELIKQLNGKT